MLLFSEQWRVKEKWKQLTFARKFTKRSTA